MTKSVRIDNEIYDLIKTHNKNLESFSDTLLRLLKEPKIFNRNEERIVCAAVNHTLTKWATAGIRHCHIRQQHGSIGLKPIDGVEGFLTNKNRFVDRKEAMQIAIKANQTINTENDELFSEDLW